MVALGAEERHGNICNRGHRVDFRCRDWPQRITAWKSWAKGSTTWGRPLTRTKRRGYLIGSRVLLDKQDKYCWRMTFFSNIFIYFPIFLVFVHAVCISTTYVMNRWTMCQKFSSVLSITVASIAGSGYLGQKTATCVIWGPINHPLPHLSLSLSLCWHLFFMQSIYELSKFHNGLSIKVALLRGR